MGYKRRFAFKGQEMERETVRETGLVTRFAGHVPQVPTAPQVDVAALTTGDEDPMYVTLQIAETGRVSGNRLRYDDALLATVEEQVVGADALMGHLPENARSAAYPVNSSGSVPFAGHWVGTTREEKVLWGKAYIPPGEVREYIRRLKATGGKLGTSIYGQGVFENQPDGTRRLKAFNLESLDFAPHGRAALKLAGDFAVTAEMDKPTRGEPMEMQVSDVPQVVREQIIQQAQATASTERVAELEEQVSEMRAATHLVAELRSTLGEGSDVLATVREMHSTLSQIAETMQSAGDWSGLPERVNEMYNAVAEMQAQQFESALDAAVAGTTADWQNAAGDKRVAALHAQVRQAALHELGSERAPERVAEAVNAAWASEPVQTIAETVRASIAGPAAVVGPKGQTLGREDLFSEEARRKRASRFGK